MEIYLQKYYPPRRKIKSYFDTWESAVAACKTAREKVKRGLPGYVGDVRDDHGALYDDIDLTFSPSEYEIPLP